MKLPRDASSSPGGEDGVVLDLTMQGDGLYHCVYTVPAFVGASRKQFALQVDTGSSDIWIASTSCTSQPSCSTFAGPKYDAAGAKTTNEDFDMTYQSGSVSGSIVLDTFEVGGYVAKTQALASATTIKDETLTTGNGFSGLLGLAPQANSVIADTLDKSDDFKDDGATFPSQLFPNSTSTGLDSTLTGSSPSSKFISLLLERPYYPGVKSQLGIGAHPDGYSSSNVQFNSIIQTTPGPLHWRLPVTKISIDLAGSSAFVSLPGTQAAGLSNIYPIAVLDSGGAMMVTTRSLANAFYGTWGVGPGKDDGLYYVPCTLSMNVTLTLGTDAPVNVPIHPLDMSLPISSDPTGTMCLGAVQPSDSIAQADIILGAAFMRNVYTVMSYETAPPKLGVLPIVNAVTAATEFNTVRVQHQQLGSGQSGSQVSNAASAETSAASGSHGPGVAIPVIAGLAGFILIAGLAVWFTSRVLHRRNAQAATGGEEADQEYAAAARARELGGKEKRAALGKSMYGMEVDEAFTMFSAGGPSGSRRPKSDKNSDVESVASASDLGLENHRDGRRDDADEEADRDFLAAPGIHLRPRHQGVDNEWSRTSMFGLGTDPRFSSVYSVHSTNSSMRGADVANAMQPVDTSAGLTFPPPTHDPVSPSGSRTSFLVESSSHPALTIEDTTVNTSSAKARAP